MASKTHVPLHGRNRGRDLAGIRVRKGTAPSPWKPQDIETNYNFPDGDGEGQSIAIAQFNGGYFEDDLSAYCQEFGKEPPDVQLIAVDDTLACTKEKILALQNPDLRKAKLERSFEVMMDLEIIAGLCPKANISMYFSIFTQKGWVDLLEKVIAAKPRPVVLSISWGVAEYDKPWTPDVMDQIDNELKKVSQRGITTCVASGDDGWKSLVDDDFAHVTFPSSSPHVMSVGGTMLKSGDEVAWNEDPIPDVDGEKYGGGATGGGVSNHFPRPRWQNNVHIASLNANRFDGRVVPDVSALAGEPYYYLRFLNMEWSAGGASASTPVWAALIARINAQLPRNKQQRFLTPLLYKKLKKLKGITVGKAAFRDIKIGNNAIYHHPDNGYKAGPGFDAVTGWGVPNGKKLLKCLTKI